MNAPVAFCTPDMGAWMDPRGALQAAGLLVVLPADYGARVRALEDEGLTTSDAQGVVDAELMTAAQAKQVQP